MAGPAQVTLNIYSNTIITLLIIYMKKLLDSDWLRAVQFKCNTSAKSVTQWKLDIVILDYDWLKDNRKIF